MVATVGSMQSSLCRQRFAAAGLGCDPSDDFREMITALGRPANMELETSSDVAWVRILKSWLPILISLVVLSIGRPISFQSFWPPLSHCLLSPSIITIACCVSSRRPPTALRAMFVISSFGYEEYVGIMTVCYCTGLIVMLILQDSGSWRPHTASLSPTVSCMGPQILLFLQSRNPQK